MNLGDLEVFDLKSFEHVVESFVNSDEVERALWVLENLPGRYRDYPPESLQKLKAEILAAMVTPHAYMSCDLDGVVKSSEECAMHLQSYLRGLLVLREVDRYNSKGLSPHIVDVGPGEYFVPLGLKHLNRNFSYWDVAMDRRTGTVAHPLLFDVRKKDVGKVSGEPTPTVFVALEVIEHLPDPRDLVVEALRYFGKFPDRVHLSTPMYTFDGRKKNWQKPCGLPHLRTYTPQEFMETANKLFPGYQWELYTSEIMSLRGCKKDAPDSVLITHEEFNELASRPKSAAAAF